jgi:hypothetical protein
MRHLDVKKPLNLAFVICFAVFISFGIYGQVFADSEPYFKTYGADDFTGGWYSAGNVCNTAGGNYQAATYGPLNNKYKGGILSFGGPSGAGRAGAASEFGAFALGLIEGNSAAAPPVSNNFGFKTGASAGNSPLSFANVDPAGAGPTFWGGLFDGSPARAPHCIPDYTSKKDAGATPWTVNNYSQNDGVQHTYGGGTIAGGTVNGGTKLTIFSSGDVYINGNIVYNNATYNATNVPKFVLIVKGNIYIAPGVNRLDGWYIAQTKGTELATTTMPACATNIVDCNSGVIWSCYDASAGQIAPRDVWVRANCLNKPLTVNGALTAKQINLVRVNDGVGLPATPSEVVNFTPEMIMGGSFFNAPPPTGGGIQSLISLPPVF